MNAKITAALALPIIYADVDLLELASLNLDGMKGNAGSYDEETGAVTGDNPEYTILGKIVRGETPTETELAYLEYIAGPSRTSPYRWDGDTNTLTFDASLVGQHLADAQVHDAAPVVVVDDGTGDDTAAVQKALNEATTPATPIASAPSAVAAASVPPITDVPFPHDIESVHAIDAHGINTVVTKTSPDGYAVNFGNGSTADGTNIASGDAMAHLPVGAKIVVGADGPTKIVLVLPETGLRGAVAGIGHTLHAAIASVWGWLVTETHAVIAGVEKVL